MNKMISSDYKQTETSEIPEDWRKTTLGSTANFHYGKGLPQKIRVDGNVPVFGSSGVTGFHNDALVKESGYIIGRKGSIGTVYFSQEPFFPIDTVYYATESDIKCDFSYFYYLLKHLKLSELNSDSAVPGLNRETAYSQKICLPNSTLEQQKISFILSSLDEKIELNRKMNQTLEEIGKTLYKRWFVDFEFPNEEGKPYKSSGGEMVNSELGEIPRGWRVRILYDLANYINGKAFKTKDFSSGGLPVIKIAELKGGITKDTKITNTEIDDKYYIDNKDLLFSWSGSPDTSINCFVWSLGPACLNQHIFKVVPKEGQTAGFVYFVLKYFMSLFIAIAKNKQTTGLGHITVADLKRVKLVQPIDNGFSDVFDSIYEELYANLRQTQHLIDIRNMLLPMLMSGRLRV